MGLAEHISELKLACLTVVFLATTFFAKQQFSEKVLVGTPS